MVKTNKRLIKVDCSNRISNYVNDIHIGYLIGLHFALNNPELTLETAPEVLSSGFMETFEVSCTSEEKNFMSLFPINKEYTKKNMDGFEYGYNLLLECMAGCCDIGR